MKDIDKQNRTINGVKYDPYAIDKMNKIPVAIKVGFLKFWAAGATYYFVGWGLGNLSPLDQMIVIGFILGLVMEYVINKILTYMDNESQSTKQYRIVRTSNLKSLFINLLLGVCFSVLIAYSFDGINKLLIRINSLPQDSVPLPVGPIVFGLIFLVYEFVFLKVISLFRKDKKDD